MAPRWRQLFDSWERAVAPALEELTASSEFRQFVAASTKRNAAARRLLENGSRRWLHAANIPAATDIRKLRRQIRELEKEVAALRRTTQTAYDLPATDRRAKLAAIDEAIAAAANPNRKKPSAAMNANEAPG